MYQNWTVAARAVSDRAVGDAIKRKCAFVEPAHFLDAMFKDPFCAAAKFLKEEMKVVPETVEAELAPMLAGIVTEKRPGKYSGDTESLLGFVSKHTSGRERRQVSTLDLLEALIRQQHNETAKMLEAHGVTIPLCERAVEGGKFRDA